MGEIIHFDFNKNNKTGDKDSVDKKQAGIEDQSGEPPKETIEEIAGPLVEFIRFVVDSDVRLKLLKLPHTDFSLSQAQDTVKDYTNRQLMDWLKQGETEWVKKPSFYKAVYYTLLDRVPPKYKKGKYFDVIK
jgi:hypothetical protein